MPEPMMKVWRPRGFAGVEIDIFENVQEFELTPLVFQNYEITVGWGSGWTRYGEQVVKYVQAEGLVLAQHPGEVCAVHASSDTLTTARTLRLRPDMMMNFASAVGVTGPVYIPDMRSPEALNRPLARLTTQAIQAFEEPTDHLEREAKLFGLIYAVLKYCSEVPPPEQKLGKEHKAVSLVKEVIQTHPEQDHPLDNLALLTQLNKYYLWEIFKRDVGLSPDQYQAYLKVCKAKDLLTKGTSVVQTALDAGFSDQSHLTRVFKKYTQVTPGRFQRDTLNAT